MRTSFFSRPSGPTPRKPCTKPALSRKARARARAVGSSRSAVSASGTGPTVLRRDRLLHLLRLVRGGGAVVDEHRLADQREAEREVVADVLAQPLHARLEPVRQREPRVVDHDLDLHAL